MESSKQSTKVVLALVIFSIFVAGQAFGMTRPAAGSFAYDLYDIGVNQILLGPIGFVGGCACMVIGAIFAVKQVLLPAAGAVLGGAFLLKADSVVESVGALIF